MLKLRIKINGRGLNKLTEGEMIICLPLSVFIR